MDKEEKYLDKDMAGFIAKGQSSSQENRNPRKGNKGWSYYGDRYRDQIKESDSDWIRKDD